MEEIRKIITVQVNGDETVKSLKQHIQELRDALLNVEKGSDDYTKITEALTASQQRLSEVLAAGSGRYSEIIAGLTDRIKELEKELGTLQVGTDEYNKVSQTLQSTQTELSKQIENLTSAETNNIKSVSELKTHITDLRDSLLSVEQGSDDYIKITDALAESQKRLSETMSAGNEKAIDSISKLGVQINELKTELNGLQQGTSEYDAVADKLSETNRQLTEEVNRLTIAESQSIGSVKELKSHINDLHSALLNVEKGSEDYINITNALADAQNRLADAMSDGNTRAVDSIAFLKSQINELETQLSGLTVGTDEYNKAADRLSNANKQLTDEVKRLTTTERESVSSIKELKQHINELKDSLLNVKEGSAEYRSIVDELISSETQLKSVMDAGKATAEAAEGSYNALVAEMSALKKVWREVGDEAERARLGDRIKEINDQLKDMDESIGNYQRNVGNYKSVWDTTQGEIIKGLRRINPMLENMGKTILQLCKNIKTTEVTFKTAIKGMKAAMASFALTAIILAATEAIRLLWEGIEKLGQKFKEMLPWNKQAVENINKLKVEYQNVTKELNNFNKGLNFQQELDMILARSGDERLAIMKKYITKYRDARDEALKKENEALQNWYNAIERERKAGILRDKKRFKEEIELYNKIWEEKKKTREKAQADLENLYENIKRQEQQNLADSIDDYQKYLEKLLSDRLKYENQVKQLAKEGYNTYVDNVERVANEVNEFYFNAYEAYVNYVAKLDESLKRGQISETEHYVKSTNARFDIYQAYAKKQMTIEEEIYNTKVNLINNEMENASVVYDKLTGKIMTEVEAQDLLNDGVELHLETLSEEEQVAARAQLTNEKLYEAASEFYTKMQQINEEGVKVNFDGIEYTIYNVFNPEKIDEVYNSLTRLNTNLSKTGKTFIETYKKNRKELTEFDRAVIALNANDFDINVLQINGKQYTKEYKKLLEERLSLYEAMLSTMEQMDGESYEDFVERQRSVTLEIKNLKQYLYGTGDNLGLNDTNIWNVEAITHWCDVAITGIDAVASALGDIASGWETLAQAQYEAGEISKAEYERQLENLKALQIAQVVVNTISGAIGAVTQAVAQLGPIAGPILGGAQAAAITAAGAMQIAAIKKTKVGSASLGSSSAANQAMAQPVITEYNPEYITNRTGMDEVTMLANAINDRPVETYIVESKVTAAQEIARQRNKETTF